MDAPVHPSARTFAPIHAQIMLMDTRTQKTLSILNKRILNSSASVSVLVYALRIPNGYATRRKIYNAMTEMVRLRLMVVVAAVRKRHGNELLPKIVPQPIVKSFIMKYSRALRIYHFIGA